ncbi:MAG TPA: hypothetical protein VMV14_05650 [Acidimicrobiales bacterium]|nr:hypothetical protein [Acidimicrobiales bacterium]
MTHGDDAHATLKAGALYLVLAAVLWQHAWTGGPSSTLASGSLDPAQDVWWLAWVPHALAHGLDPLRTRAMFAPAGVNVLANTSFVLPSLVLWPVTALFGPVLSFNVAVTLAPVLDALGAFAVARRYVRWAPSAWVAGLVYGFGPFVATDLRFGHLNLTLLVVPPLLLLALDEVLVRQRRPAWAAGAMVGALVVAEFFVSVEMLALTVVMVVVGLAAVVVGAPRWMRPRAAYAGRALGWAVAISSVVLAYPTWWYLDGPRHFTGAVWGDMARFAASLSSFVVPHGQLAGVTFLTGGNGDYVGPTLLVIVVAGAVALRRRPPVALAGALALAAAVMALWWPLLHLPLLDSVAASRFGAFVDLFAAVVLAVVLDTVHRATVEGAVGPGREHRARALALAVVAVGPLALVPPWPYPTRSLSEPTVWRSAAVRSLPPGAVVREYPPAQSDLGDELVWQAEASMAYATVDGYAIVPGPDGRATIRPPDDVMDEIFAAFALGRARAPFAPSLVAAVAGHAWDHRAAAVVVELHASGGPLAAALLTEALGPPAERDTSGVVWRAPLLSAAAGAGSSRGPRAGAGSARAAPAARGRSTGPPAR